MPSGQLVQSGRLRLINCQIVDIPVTIGKISVVTGTVYIQDRLIEHVDALTKHSSPLPAGPEGSTSELLVEEAWPTVDLDGSYVLPGFCDAHVHVTAVTADLKAIASLPPSLITARSSVILRDMLFRGFTTVRDAGGCDWGLARAVEEGTLVGPRILFSGHALSQTGGHGDMRERGDDSLVSCGCCHGTNVTLGRVCDGVAEVRRAARDELRKGASQIKMMASGGVASPTDRLSNLQFSVEETRALVEEAFNAGTYVCAHAYSAQAIRRALECGVRSIEHGNLIDEATLDLLISKDAFLVPTLVTYDRIRAEGVEAGMPAALVDKVADILERGVEAVGMAHRKGAKICFGSDLLGAMHKHQSAEFAIRSRVQPPEAILRSATTTFAELSGMQGKVGCIVAGAFADLVVVKKEKSPLEDITVLCDPANILMVIKEGRIELDRRNLSTANG